MIYVVIADILNSERDCHNTWQPQNLLPEGIREYIGKTKNEKMRAERFLAYTTLLCSLERFFSVNDPIIERNPNGKPYLKNSNIQISISHCDGVAVTAICDEGQIGVDIQSVIDEEKAKRLEKRFFAEILLKNENVDVKYFSLEFSNNEARFNEILPERDKNKDFLSKWVYTESVIKTYGLSFSDISKINEFASSTLAQIVDYKNFKIATTIAK